MAGMTDQALVNTLLNNILHTSTTATWTPGTGGTALTITVPLHLRLYSVTGTESASGTELTAGNCPGYTAGGLTLGTTAFTAASAGTTGNGNSVTWTATGTWVSAVNGIEIWDTSGTPVRLLWGALTVPIGASTVINADTITFAVTSITVNASTW